MVKDNLFDVGFTARELGAIRYMLKARRKELRATIKEYQYRQELAKALAFIGAYKRIDAMLDKVNKCLGVVDDD